MIKVKTKYSDKLLMDFYRFTAFRGKYYRYGVPAFLVVMLVFVVLAIFLLQSRQASEGSQFIGWLLIGIIVFLAIMLFILMVLSPKLYIKRAGNIVSLENEMIFTENAFTVISKGDFLQERTEMNYDFLFRVYETKKYFYVYMDPVRAYIIPKDDIIEGTSEGLRQLLITKPFKKKYVVCK